MHGLQITASQLPTSGLFLSLSITLPFFLYSTLQLANLFITPLNPCLTFQKELVCFLSTGFLRFGYISLDLKSFSQFCQLSLIMFLYLFLLGLSNIRIHSHSWPFLRSTSSSI